MVELNDTRIPKHCEVTLKTGSDTLRLFDPGPGCELSHDLLCEAGRNRAIVFVVNLISYHKHSVTAEGIRGNLMMGSLHLLKSLIASVSQSTIAYRRTAIMIVFTNTPAFEQHQTFNIFGIRFVLRHEEEASQRISEALHGVGPFVSGSETYVHFAKANNQECFQETWRFIQRSWGDFGIQTQLGMLTP